MDTGHLIEELMHPEISVRIRAAKALGWTEDEMAIAPLVDALLDTDEAVRYQASLSLKELTKKDFGTDFQSWKEYCAQAR